MPKLTGQVTERSFYEVLIQIITENGGSGVSEVRYKSQPDVVFSLLGREWILSVKLGEDIPTLKSAFIQYQQHKDDTGLEYGLILFLPSSLRSTPVRANAMRGAVDTAQVTCLIDTPLVKEELRGLTFQNILTNLIKEIGPKLEVGESKGYPLELVIQLLQQHVDELMGTVSLDDPTMLRVITDKNLLSGMGHLAVGQTEDVARFLAAYILLSQILFLRLFSSAQPDKVTIDRRQVTSESLRMAFAQVLKINYRPIFELNVLDSVSPEYVKDTFQLIWGLEVERVRYELPGRIFHELMPAGIRKMLAAFYTRPQAADILASLTIAKSNETVFDPACGSGTILTAAYRMKFLLHSDERIAGNPHKRFCESEIFGADIMPFAVHLTAANLAAMDPGVTIGRTQIIQGDSLGLSLGKRYKDGVQASMLPSAREGMTSQNQRYPVDLEPVDVILMNPPFTKVERGIRRYIDMSRFEPITGAEIGLWGHFIPLADEFLADGGIYGAVLPINILRGRESSKIRDFIFKYWTPLYILKPTFNYGFSEWSEYRDIILVARKGTTPKDQDIKIGLVKQDLTELTRESAYHITRRVVALTHLRCDDLDIQSFKINDLRNHSMNLMWFCGVTDFQNRDILISFFDKFKGCMEKLPNDYVREGLRSERGMARFLFLTRKMGGGRDEEAFLSFQKDSNNEITATSSLGTEFEIEKSVLSPSLRTGIGLDNLDVGKTCDYIARQPYRALRQVQRASGFEGKIPSGFWQSHEKTVDRNSGYLLTSRRINPYSPNTHLFAFVSDVPICPGDQFKSINENDLGTCQALGVILNSAFFWSQFMLLKEESTGRFLDLRAYDLYEMLLKPSKTALPALTNVFFEYKNAIFPSLREQFDLDFDPRYKEFWDLRKHKQASLLSYLNQPVRPSAVRINFDLAVCKALGIDMDAQILTELYGVIVKEMIITRGLTRD
jgi:hypothetical protein